MRITRRLALLASATALVVGATAAPASAAPADTTVPVVGGTTSVTVNAGVTKYLLSNKILPYAIDASTRLVSTRDGWTVRYGFPITSDSSVTVAGDPLTITGGDIGHTGGLRFVNLRNFKALKVSDFDIRLDEGLLYATKVNNQAAEVPVFVLKPVSLVPRITSDGFAIVRHVGLELTGAAAAALNASLRTDAFAGGIAFGTATVKADITP
jgi:hypothetical protein